MTRVVGHRDRDEFELDPALAHRRGRLLDAMLSSARQPIARGVYRGTHEAFNRMDDERCIAVARRLNASQ